MDLNEDGHIDILSGSYSAPDTKPMAGHFQVLWGKEGGVFTKAEVLKGTDGEPLEIKGSGELADVRRICTRPFSVDWDGDGDLDLIVGNFEGTFYLFKGLGKGKFSPKSEAVLCDGKLLKIEGLHSDPFCLDFDGDGDLDLLSGSSQGGAQWAENVAGAGRALKLKAFTELVPAAKDSHLAVWWDEEIKIAGSTRIWVDDLNGDGKLDILLGDCYRIKKPVGDLSKKELLEQEKEWSEMVTEIYNNREELEKKGNEEKMKKLQEKLRSRWNERRKFITEESTGHVWVYYQK